MKKGAIFDMDGLLFDTESLYKQALLEIPIEFGLIADPMVSEVTRGAGGEYLRKALRQYYPTVDADAFILRMREYVWELTRKGVPEKPGIREILSYIRGLHIKTALASSSPRTMIDKYLNMAKIHDCFDAIVSVEEVARSKPEPDIFLAAAEKIGENPHDCYVFEDSCHGIRAAYTAGCSAIMIPDLSIPSEADRMLCTGIYNSLLDAMAAIKCGEI